MSEPSAGLRVPAGVARSTSQSLREVSTRLASLADRVDLRILTTTDARELEGLLSLAGHLARASAAVTTGQAVADQLPAAPGPTAPQDTR